MRCLVISPTPSHPGNAGNRQRIQALLARLKGFGHEVHFCFVMRETVGEADLAAMRAAWDSLITLPYDRKQEQRSLGQAFAIDDWFPASLQASIAAIADADSYDLVLVEYVFLSKALELFPPGTLKIIDTHDVFAHRDRRLKAIGLEPSFFYTTPEEEARGLDRADLVLAIQDEERAELEERSRAVVVTLGHVPEAAGQPPRDAAAAPVIGYLGSANPINQTALRALLGALDLPALAAQGARLLVGGGASRAAEGQPAPVQPVGEVAELAGFYAGIDLAVNPHQGGTGLKIKTVEALAHGRPVLGTADAFLGLEPEAPYHAAPGAAALAPHLLRYAAEPGFRAEVAAASRALYARYMATVERQAALLRNRAALRAALQRPRVLLVTDLPFWQESLGNHARIAEMLRVGRQLMDIDVFALRSLSPAERGTAQRMVGGRGRVFSFKDYPAGSQPLPSWIETAGLMQPFERTQFARAFFGALEAHLARHSYAIGIVEYIRLSYLRHAKGFPALSVLDTHDVMSLRAQNFAHFGLEHHIRIEVPDELRIMDGFDLLLAIQAEEHRFLSRSLPGKSLYLPHSMPASPRIDSSRPARRVIFVGGDSPMNRDGLRWFAEQVWPCFQQGEAELHVAGSVCETLRDLALPGRRIVLHGQVADLAGFLDAADIGINPVFYGGGLKIKTVEYLCRGIPSVLSEEAVFGIEGGAGSAYLLARSRSEFVAGLDRLLRDPAERLRVSAAAHGLGRRHFGRAVSRRALQAMVDQSRGMEAPPRRVA
ncbi:glycosyltransferase [Pseudoroseomonas cervicalis]|uniref:glycosyltransferase n=1 Tax=Teichococcus cervicalis TaxID=204525 RepID=UPI0022F16576|nr:glycosyltransferase [Pseudoroseomonas cervicalis]WBV44752.1 glycosyltransferase [Pseudoroseomonas cervicalis]